MPRIDDAAWNEGRQQFAEGFTLRQVVESMPGDDASAEDQERAMSRALGFADAFLALLRGS